MNFARHAFIRLVAAASPFALYATASAQAMTFPTGPSPALQLAAAPGAQARSVAASTLPAQLTDAAGRTFKVTYDENGRLSAVKNAAGRNIADMMVGYDSMGRIQRVRFDNGYQLIFQYRTDGTEEVRDSLGSQLVRTGTPLVAQSMSDRSGHLAETLTRVEHLFAVVQPVQGLNTAVLSSGTE